MSIRTHKQICNLILYAWTAVIFSVSLFAFTGVVSAFQNDGELSSGNSFEASSLDLRLTNQLHDGLIGPEAGGDVSHGSVALPESGSLPMQYRVSFEATGDNALCGDLALESKRNGIEVYDAALTDFYGATTTELGSWEFDFDLPPVAPAVAPGHGEKCEADIVFEAWRDDVATPEESGYTDEERFSFSFEARMVVLNEIYPNPDGGTAPADREYIELFNNGSTPVDVLGWSLSEISGVTETFYTVVAGGAIAGQMQPYDGASTVIPSGGRLVLEFGGSSSHLNNSGDTVRLYDASFALLDAHSYPDTASGKSHVRFPDGIGFWVDPEPTPGEENQVTMEDLEAAGFSEDMIEMILSLAELRGAQLAETATSSATSTTIEIDEMLEEAVLGTSTATSTDEESEESGSESGGSGSGLQEEEVVATSTASTTPEAEESEDETEEEEHGTSTPEVVLEETSSSTPETEEIVVTDEEELSEEDTETEEVTEEDELTEEPLEEGEGTIESDDPPVEPEEEVVEDIEEEVEEEEPPVEEDVEDDTEEQSLIDESV